MMDAHSLLWLNKQNQELKHCLKLLAMFCSNLKYSLGPSSIVEPRGSSKPEQKFPLQQFLLNGQKIEVHEKHTLLSLF